MADPVTVFYYQRTIVLTLFALSIYVAANGQVKSDTAAPLPTEEAMVVRVTELQTAKPRAGLGDYIKVEVSNIHSLLNSARDNREQIVLYINEIPMRGIYAQFISTREKTLIFKLSRDTVSLRAWNVFYQGQTFDSKRTVSMSVGFLRAGPLKTNVHEFTLLLVRTNLLLISLGGILIMLVLFIILSKRTGIIRADNVHQNEGPFSLARTQLAFWTFIIAFSVIYIWIVTGELPPISGSTLVLLSISLTTMASAKVIDSSKEDEVKVGQLKSEGFFKDIMSDYIGVSIHRFQMVLWTLILGISFLKAVGDNLSMPQMDESLLILMGISSGAYLGLKIPEKTDSQKITGTNQKEISEDIPAVG